MQVSVETTQGLERRLTITVPAATVSKEIENRLRGLAKTQRIDGFRPGKVPAKVIKKRFGAAVAEEVAGEIMQRNFYEAIVAEKLNLAGAPTLEPAQVKEGEDFSFTATLEVYPEFEVSGIEAIEIEKSVSSVTDADVDGMIETLRKQHAEWVTADRAAEANDQVKVNFNGSIDGEEFEGGKAEDFTLAMGQGRMIPGFEEGIVGKSAGEEFTVEVTFPEEYHAENLKGKTASFAITLNAVEAQELPEINAEFVGKFGVEDGTLESLKTEISKNMSRELEQAIKADTKTKVLDALVETNDIEIPAALIKQEIVTLRQQAMQRFGQMAPQNAPELPDELFTEQASRRVKIGLVLGEFIKVNEITADDARVQDMIASMASAYEDPAEVIAHYKDNDQALENVRNVAVEDQAIDLVLEKANVTEKEVAFEELMNKATQNA
ncbi:MULTISPECIES: trigger factor [unclassified Moritella]|uniref:trigger factor n=1 Tax=unclassified Moritella TaxID=2637987 RepID=UPI001BA989E8|nr:MULTISPECIES: trigger factor [unclassified Moritella]QUM79671.1 trigger factor [Moritella sp. 5]QUM83894.1 trigger factor [Moritella sp. 28]QUM88203.1 trigger factor [Moritella sp. 36]